MGVDGCSAGGAPRARVGTVLLVVDDRAQQAVAQGHERVDAGSLQDRFQGRGGRRGLAQGEREHGRALADPEGTQARLQLVGIQPAGQRLGQDVAGHVALQQFVALVEQLREDPLGDGDERQLIRHLEQGEAELARRVEHGGGDFLVDQARAEAEAGDLALGETLHELALELGAGELQARGQQQLASAQPGRGVEQLGGVHPAHIRLGVFLAGGERQVELGDQACDGEHLTALRGRTESTIRCGSWGEARCPTSSRSAPTPRSTRGAGCPRSRRTARGRRSGAAKAG